MEKEKEKKKSVRAKKTDWQDKYLRLAAEFDNFKKRTERERAEVYNLAKADTIAGFLSVVDSIEQAISQTEDEGLQALKRQIDDVFQKLGIEEIDNTMFDPKFHNAILHEEDDSRVAGEIVGVFQKGYKIGDRVIRHSMVKSVN